MSISLGGWLLQPGYSATVAVDAEISGVALLNNPKRQPMSLNVFRILSEHLSFVSLGHAMVITHASLQSSHSLYRGVYDEDWEKTERAQD